MYKNINKIFFIGLLSLGFFVAEGKASGVFKEMEKQIVIQANEDKPPTDKQRKLCMILKESLETGDVLNQAAVKMSQQLEILGLPTSDAAKGLEGMLQGNADIIKQIEEELKENGEKIPDENMRRCGVLLKASS